MLWKWLSVVRLTTWQFQNTQRVGAGGRGRGRAVGEEGCSVNQWGFAQNVTDGDNDCTVLTARGVIPPPPMINNALKPHWIAPFDGDQMVTAEIECVQIEIIKTSIHCEKKPIGWSHFSGRMWISHDHPPFLLHNVVYIWIICYTNKCRIATWTSYTNGSRSHLFLMSIMGWTHWFDSWGGFSRAWEVYQ